MSVNSVVAQSTWVPQLLTVDEERASVVDKDLRAFVDRLAAALLPRGRGLVEKDAVAGDLRGRAHLRDVEVLSSLMRAV